jgi:hypothetical protein
MKNTNIVCTKVLQVSMFVIFLNKSPHLGKSANYECKVFTALSIFVVVALRLVMFLWRIIWVNVINTFAPVIYAVA